MTDEHSRADRRDQRRGLFWAKVSGIGAVLTIVVSLGIYWWPRPGNPQTETTVIGDCNAVGSGAVACATLNPYKLAKFATATIGRLPDMKTYVLDGSLPSLPRPPDYDPSIVTDHCDEWEKWIQANKLFAKNPELLVSAQTGPGDTLSVTDATVQVLSRKRLSALTEITCGSGAGTLTPGSHIEVDTRTGRAQASQGSDYNLMTDPEPHPMPPAQINLTSSDGESVSVGIAGEPGLAYSGIVTIHLIVDGKERVAVLGSKKAPYRWIAPGGRPSSGPFWDWNPVTHRWTQDAFNELNPANADAS